MDSIGLKPIDIMHHSGHITEMFAAYFLANRGYNILWPLKTQSKYDLVIEYDGKLFKVQVKKATWSRAGSFEYLQSRLSKDKRTSSLHYKDTDVDYFLITDRNKVWLIPYEDIKDMKSVCLSSTNPNYKPYSKYDPDKWLV